MKRSLLGLTGAGTLVLAALGSGVGVTASEWHDGAAGRLGAGRRRQHPGSW